MVRAEQQKDPFTGWRTFYSMKQKVKSHLYGKKKKDCYAEVPNTRILI
jgi:hypothetical protein